MGLFTPSLYNLVPGYGPYALVKAVVDIITGSNRPAPPPPQQTQLMALASIGWTQKSSSPKVYDVSTDRYNTMQGEVARALAFTDVTERLRYFSQTRRFDPLVVFYDPQAQSYLSIDNRRLAIYHMSLPPSARVPVQVVTRDQAAQMIAARLNQGRDEAGQRLLTPEQAIIRRYTNRQLGNEICITGDGRMTISRRVSYLETPYMELTTPGPSRVPRGIEGQPYAEHWVPISREWYFPAALPIGSGIVFNLILQPNLVPRPRNTKINIFSANMDQLLHLSFGTVEIVINSRYAGAGWMKNEIHIMNAAIFRKQSTTIVVIDRGDYFHILEGYRTLAYYKKRISKPAVSANHCIYPGQVHSLFRSPMLVKYYEDYDQHVVEKNLLAN